MTRQSVPQYETLIRTWAYIFICPCLPLSVESISQQAEIIATQNVLLIPNGSMGESALIPTKWISSTVPKKGHIYYSLCNYIMVSRLSWLILLINSFYDYILPFARQTKCLPIKYTGCHRKFMVGHTGLSSMIYLTHCPLAMIDILEVYGCLS